MQKEKIRQKQKGITLIALIITIIVMLILVGVSVTVALKGGLFSSAQGATTQTQIASEKEQLLSIALGALNNEGIVDPERVDAALAGTNFEKGEGGVYTSTKTGKTYVVSERGSITEKQGLAIEPKKETYEEGEEVTIGDEHFFVITDEAEKVTLLAKYNLNQEGTAQLNATYTETACEFSSINYWSSETEYPLDLNTYTISEGVTSVITKAKVYGVKIGGEDAIGRLMTKDEAEELVTEYSGIIYGTSIDATDGYLRYWLGSAKGTSHLWEIRGYDPFVGSSVSAINYDLSGNLRSTPSYRNL